MATKALKRVYAALAQVDRAARRNDCNKVMSSMAIVWANYGEAYAHTESMDSSPTQKQYTNNLLGVVQRAERLGDTIVYQCTRKKGGIR